MKELSIEEKAKAYDEAIKRAKELLKIGVKDTRDKRVVLSFFPELKESEDERIRKYLSSFVELNSGVNLPPEEAKKILAWLEKQGEQMSDPRYSILDKLIEADDIYQMSVNDAMVEEAKNKAIEVLSKLEISKLLELEKQCEKGANGNEREIPNSEQKPCMIQWQGNNLKEVIDFVGKDKNFGKWFKSFEEYEKSVHEHNDIFKLFNEDGSHYEVPVGAWIVKTPDGYNVASKAVLKQKPAWSEEDETKIKSIIVLLKSPTLCAMEGNKGIIAANIKYLNSLKERIGNFDDGYKAGFSAAKHNQWKPSDEQMNALEDAIRYGEEENIGILSLLYNELKKLKGE